MSERGMTEGGAQFTLGKIHTADEQRDAIHIAVAPVIATERLSPGQRIGLVGHDNKQARASATGEGIVDPFLQGAVFPGDRFWMFLLPNTITSLRHQWTHPHFDSDNISQTDHATKSRAWVKEHAETLGLADWQLMEDAKHWLQYEEHKVQQGSETWRDCFNPGEFWHHYEIVTETPVPEDMKRSFYCCTC